MKQKTFSQLFRFKFIHFVFLGCSLLIAGLYLTYRRGLLTPSPATIAEISPTGTVSLMLATEELRLRPLTTTTAHLSAASGADNLTSVVVEILFDPAQVEISDVTFTDRLPTIIEPIANNNGRLTFTLGADLQTEGVSGTGDLASFTVKPLVPGDIALTFGPQNIATTFGVDDNMLMMVASPTVKSLHPGDITGDKVVDIFDFSALLQDFDQTGEIGFSLADLKPDGIIDVFDFNQLLFNFEKIYE